ncbi:HAD family hydrolase [Bifidobacterium eulemuris]|uniref:HAD family phosphatase n=1 Tax=Bifidobacterium eulemuris TaxID=1765219 RepID=A0A261GAP3_9BIFI|nr:HAD family phosphatase [Bifidobacterium eulemuris]OZG68313.1 haloacid dehalogenase [Bifidobacterium eulemuris]QOL31637.1 HAD family phosphatase [Bifidobacterium eulemuris]
MKGWPGEPDMDYDVMVEDGEAAANAGKPVTDVIFDFGNVLIYWDPAAVLVPRYSQETIDQFLDNDISGFYDGNDMMDGGMTTTEGIEWMRRTHGDKWADILEYYIANFRDSLTGIVPGARVLVNDLKAAGVRVWGLSNWEKELFSVAEEQCDILRELDGKIVSGFVGMRKPHKDIYERALQEFGITAEGAVFIDDKAMNIVGANEAGIRGVRFQDPVKLRELLIATGVGIPAVR